MRVAAGSLGIIHEEITVLCVIRMKSQSEQALFIARGVHQRIDVQEWFGQHAAERVDYFDDAILFDDKQAAVATMRDIYRTVESGYEIDQLNFGLCRHQQRQAEEGKRSNDSF